jgi:cytochrome c5
MKKVILPLAAMIIVCNLLMVSCSKDNEASLNQDPGTDTTGTGGGGGNTCDTANMKYAANVQPIISASCYSCHGNGSSSGGISLDSYAKLKTLADNGKLLGTIEHASGYIGMPLGGAKLADCSINKIKSWINHGTLNN